MKALALSRTYFCEIAKLQLQTHFPDLYPRLAAGLVGNGSECFEYDDELSRDHDWGVDFFIWLSESDRHNTKALKEWKMTLFEKKPPLYPRTRSEYGAAIGVMTTGDFYKSLIGYPDGPNDIQQWRRIPEENLAMVTNGAIFMDNCGEFTRTREKLMNYYPEELRKKKLAARLMAMAQTGQYNVTRCFFRKDWVTYHSVLTRFIDSTIATVFLLNKTYRPYYKWAWRKMTALPLLGSIIGSELSELAVTCGIDEQSYNAQKIIIDNICARIAEALRLQNLAKSYDWFLTTQAEEIQSTIRDSFLRALPAQYE